MIKAVIMDVDGVIVGKKEGFNFPLPNAEVISVLEGISKKGIPIVLCTAKFHVAIDGIIQQAKLNNPHITDGGALIINPLSDQKIVEEVCIAEAVVSEYLSHNEAYTEVYSADTYYVQKGINPKFMAKRIQLLQAEPTIVDPLSEIKADVIKIISFADDDDDIPRIESQVKKLGDKVHYIWSHHPFIAPMRPCVITQPGVSKEHAARRVAEYLQIDLSEILGIGDSKADWDFMKLCGYTGMVGDNSELKALVLAKGDKGYVGGSVDNHGILDIFNHFKV